MATLRRSIFDRRLWRRVEPVEIAAVFDAADDTAAPPRRPGGPHIGLSTGPLASRRTTRQPAPPQRIRPPDLEANSTGLALYGARSLVPWPYADLNAVAARDAASVGEVVRYQVPDTATAARVRVLVNRSATAGALVVHVCLVRNGIDQVLRILANVDYESPEPITLVRGDALRVHVATAGTAGVTVTSLLSVEERT